MALQEEMIRNLIGERITLTHWAFTGEGEVKGGFSEYEAGVRYVNGVKLVSATEIGIVVESTGSSTDGEKFFLPWSAVIILTEARESDAPDDVF